MMKPLTIMIAGAFTALAACATNTPVIEAGTPYAGPVIEFDSSGRTHIAKITAPSGGWAVRHDLTRQGWPDAEAFITLVAPPEGSMVTQALVEHLVDTQVSTSEGCRLMVRRTERVPERISDGAYREAARAGRKAI